MVEISDIKDRKSLEAWLNAFPGGEGARRKAAVAIAVRTAHRVLPIAWEWYSSDAARKRDLTAIAVLRSALFSLFADTMPTNENRRAADAAARAAYAADAAARAADAAYAAARAADAAAYAANATSDAYAAAAADAAAYAAYAANATSAAANAVIWSAIQTDCQMFLEGKDPRGTVLWSGDNPFDDIWSKVKSAHTARPFGSGNFGEATFSTIPGGPWAFWIDWYEKVLNGQPQDWDLLQAIVDADIDWDGPVEGVNEAIQRVEHEYLRDTVNRLKEETSKVLALADDLPNRGHNNPPELIETDADAKASVTFIWADLDDAEKELDKDDPDPSALKRIGQSLVSGAAKVLAYIGRKADVFIDASLKGAGLTGSAWLVTQFPVVLEAIQKFGGALLEFAQRFFV